MDPQNDPGRAPGFETMTPVLCVHDLGASLRYYRDRLGFAVQWQWSESAAFADPEQPTFACVQRGAVCLFLCERGQGQPGSWICVNVASPAALDELHREYLASGAIVVTAPTAEPWGMIEMIVEDPDGNTLRVGAPAPEGA